MEPHRTFGDQRDLNKKKLVQVLVSFLFNESDRNSLFSSSYDSFFLIDMLNAEDTHTHTYNGSAV